MAEKGQNYAGNVENIGLEIIFKKTGNINIFMDGIQTDRAKVRRM